MKKIKFILIGLFIASNSGNATDYSSMSCYDLWYARNQIFANEGYCFQTGKALNVFGRRCYPPYGRLNGWERDEVSRIKYWERQKGCNGRVSPYYGNYSGHRYARVVGIRYDDTLAVRTGPSTGYMKIGDLPPDATGVEVLNCVNSWCRVRYGNLLGWSSSRYLSFY